MNMETDARHGTLWSDGERRCVYCLVGTPHHPSASDLHVILVHDGVRFVECTEADG